MTRIFHIFRPSAFILAFFSFTISHAHTPANLRTVVIEAGAPQGGPALATDLNGLPVMAYIQGDVLKFLTCAESTCDSVFSIQLLDTSSFRKIVSSLLIGPDGLPFILYANVEVFVPMRVETSTMALKCGNPMCSSNNVVTLLDSASTVRGPAVAGLGADGFPALFYDDDGFHKILKCGNAACSSGNLESPLDSLGHPNGFKSIAVGSDGYPILGYFETKSGVSDGYFLVTKCGDAACSSGNRTTRIDSSCFGGSKSSVAIGSDGLPVFSYYAYFRDALKIVHCGDPQCSSGNTVTMLDTVGSYVGSENLISLVPGGNPVIAYTSQYYASGPAPAIDKLLLVRCGDPTCSAPISKVELDSMTYGFGLISGPCITPSRQLTLAYTANTNSGPELVVLTSSDLLGVNRSRKMTHPARSGQWIQSEGGRFWMGSNAIFDLRGRARKFFQKSTPGALPD